MSDLSRFDPPKGKASAVRTWIKGLVFSDQEPPTQCWRDSLEPFFSGQHLDSSYYQNKFALRQAETIVYVSLGWLEKSPAESVVFILDRMVQEGRLGVTGAEVLIGLSSLNRLLIAPTDGSQQEVLSFEQQDKPRLTEFKLVFDQSVSLASGRLESTKLVHFNPNNGLKPFAMFICSSTARLIANWISGN